jgi:hypothetical protein
MGATVIRVGHHRAGVGQAELGESFAHADKEDGIVGFHEPYFGANQGAGRIPFMRGQRVLLDAFLDWKPANSYYFDSCLR